MAPIAARIGKIRETRGQDAAIAAALDEADWEHEIFRRHHEVYGYVFYLLERDEEGEPAS